VKFPDYMIPSHFEHLAEMPLSAHGKKDRTALIVRKVDDRTSIDNYIKPEGEFEELLAEIWEEVLRCGKIGRYENFLHLGGNSLAAIRITARINEALHLDLPLSRIFEFPTVKELASQLEKTIRALMEDSVDMG
jgi:acyl carrier protein